MSVKLMGQVFDLDLPRPEAWVLMALVDHAGHDGSRIFPSVDLIAWKTGYKRRQVQNIMASLRARGLIVLVEEARDHRAREYRAEFADAPRKPVRSAKSAPRDTARSEIVNASRGMQPDGPGVQGDEERGATAAASEPSAEPSGQSPAEPSLARSRHPQRNYGQDPHAHARDDDAGFSRFWAAYPKKVQRHNALKVWRKISPAEALIDTIVDVVKRQSLTPEWQKNNGQFVPHPTTYLNGRRWEDEGGGGCHGVRTNADARQARWDAEAQRDRERRERRRAETAEPQES